MNSGNAFIYLCKYMCNNNKAKKDISSKGSMGCEISWREEKGEVILFHF